MTVDWDSVPNPPRYYNMNGEGISLREWLKLSETFGDHDPMRVALTERDDVMVSTVLLGLDHSFGRQGPPLIFETMIFGGDHDEHQERYATKEEALAGHARACALAFGDLAVVEGL